ncbi:MAG: cyanoexosortase A system-associated protein [Xenococcaceae cyanobacterium MO_188.B32]|nr:cyanoexosortase A system-associated protein [Xenococcaceae cyanobacterium MO_188.B32]
MTVSLTIIYYLYFGSYGILIHQDQLHLSSCITPQGSSIVSKTNFYQNYPAFQLLSDRLVFWLLGEKPIVENVCLWSHLSIPISDSSPEKAYLTLENVWFSWYEHWHPYLVTMVNSN